MDGSSSSNFTNIIVIGERIESGIKSGKITGGNSNPQSADRKASNGYAKEKEGETNDVTTSVPQYQSLMAPMAYFPYPYVATA